MTSREQAIDAAGAAYAEGIARQAARPAREAAIAAGCVSEEQIADWIAEFRPPVAPLRAAGNAR